MTAEPVEADFDADSDLIDEIRALRIKLKAHSALMRKMNFRTRVAQVLGAIAVLGITAAMMVAWSNRKAIQSVEDVRRESRVVACVRDNIGETGDRSSALNAVLVMFGLAGSGDLSAEAREKIVAALEPDVLARYRELEAQVAHDNPFRDCSHDGIAAYYADIPDDPAKG